MTRDELVETLARVLRAGPPLRFALLFGSHATGKARATSDVDLAIVPADSDLPLRAELELAAAVETATGRRTDIVRLDTAPLLLRWEVARTGVPVYGDHADIVRFLAMTASEHADLGPSLARAAETYRRRLAGST